MMGFLSTTEENYFYHRTLLVRFFVYMTVAFWELSDVHAVVNKLISGEGDAGGTETPCGEFIGEEDGAQDHGEYENSLCVG